MSNDYTFYLQQPVIIHYGVKGMKWGIRRTPEQLGHHAVFKKSDGGSYSKDDTVFISGKVKYDEPVNDTIKKELYSIVSSGAKIIIGDAPGADTRVQDYLSELGYNNVIVYTTDNTVRNNVGNWKVEKISDHGLSEEREIRAQKDIAMSKAATKGFVISSDDDRVDSATSKNIERLLSGGKLIQFYDYKQQELRSNSIKHSNDDIHYHFKREDYKMSNDYTFYLQQPVIVHYGTKGQKWGERRWQNPDGSLTEAGRIHYGYGSRVDADSISKDRQKYIDSMDKTLLRSASKTEKRLQKLVEKYSNRPKDLKKLEEANLLKLQRDMKINIKDFDTAVDLIKDMPDEDFEKLKKIVNKEYTRDGVLSLSATLLSSAAARAIAWNTGSPIVVHPWFHFNKGLAMKTHERKNDNIHYSKAEKGLGYNQTKASYLISHLKKNYESAFEKSNISAMEEAKGLLEKDKEQISNRKVR